MNRKTMMNFSKFHQVFSFKGLFILLVVLVFIVQMAVILYNHYSGYHLLHGFEYFLFRMFRGMVMGLTAAVLIIIPDLVIINYLNRFAPWNRNILKRTIFQFVLTVSIAVAVSLIITSLVNWVQPYNEPFSGVMISNVLIYAVVNILVVAILEGWIFFAESRQAELKAKNLQEELSQIKFEVLKSQINPHFMFNSLNVLSGLINTDTEKAQQFIDEFSHIYRYVIESIEQPVASLENELDFTRSYLFLQQIRYGKDLSYTVNLQAHLMKLVLPPLSLQVVLENAIKHNMISESKPLQIEIYNQNKLLVVKNNLQPKISIGVSTGIGLKNLSKRYSLISDYEPEFIVGTNYYIVKLPLIDIEENEGTNY